MRNRQERGLLPVEMTGLGFKAKVHVLPANMGGMSLELLEGGLAGAVTFSQPSIYRKENRLQQQTGGIGSGSRTAGKA